MVGLERFAVCVAERVGEFFGRVGDVVAEGLGGEVEAAGELRVSDMDIGLRVRADEKG